MITIGRRPPPAHDVIAALLECHERIRRFLAMAEVLGARADLSGDQVHDAARDLERYFSAAFLRHAEDEDLRLFPVLRARGANLEPLLLTLGQHHQTLDLQVGSLLERWRRLITEPGALPELQPSLVQLGAPFAKLLLEHLVLEEAELFPVARSTLRPEDHQAIKAAMDRARGLAAR
ncbi:MAG: hemerythrin domain-containing protein [Deltaproteobacteria bacterium]|nr:hemerythrin domain-containing protein [Deltaproteobacteria bacterium]